MTRHVLHITGCLGGVETWLRLFAEYHDRQALRASFILPAECALADYARAQGMYVAIVPMTRALSLRSDLRAMRTLRAILREQMPDIVHLHSSKAGLIGRLACRGWRPRVIYTPHAYFYLGKCGVGRGVFLQAERLLDRASQSLTLGTSPSEQRRAIDDIGCAPTRVSHVLNAVDRGVLERLRQPDLPHRRRVILVARIGAQKNIPMYLDVVRLLRGRVAADCCLIGVGHYADDVEQLRAMLADAQLSETDLTIVPWMARTELLQWLASAAVVVLTSTYESFGYVLAEANCLGVPVVGTRVDGISDVIEHGVNGYLVPCGDAAAMAERIVTLMSDDSLWSTMSERALRVAAERFDIRLAVERLLHFYQDIDHGPD